MQGIWDRGWGVAGFITAHGPVLAPLPRAHASPLHYATARFMSLDMLLARAMHDAAFSSFLAKMVQA